MSDDDLTMRQGSPEYAVEWQAEMELWVVMECGFPLCYCPEKGSALFVANACLQQRRAVVAYGEALAAAARRDRVIGLN